MDLLYGERLADKIIRLKEKYKGMWLAIKVTKRDEHGLPVAGELVAKADSHNGLHKLLSGEEVYETYAGKIPTKAILF